MKNLCSYPQVLCVHMAEMCEPSLIEQKLDKRSESMYKAQKKGVQQTEKGALKLPV